MDQRSQWADGAAVKARRRQLGWSQRELAERAGISKRTVENIENKRCPVLLHSLRATAEALGVDVRELVTAHRHELQSDSRSVATPLAEMAPREPLHWPSSHRERRAATILAVRVSGLQDLSQTEDVETEDEILDQCFAPLEAALHRAGGAVIQATREGLFAIFGFPLTCEDHVLRALYAALQIPAILDRAGAEMQIAPHASFAPRIGVHTGHVIVGGGQPGQNLSFLSRARLHQIVHRLQDWAPEGAIVVSQSVQQQAVGFFRFRDDGVHALPDIVEPVHVYTCEGPIAVTSRLEATLARGRSAFHGRCQELSFLHARWARVSNGEGQVVCMIGEAGVGKSRLAAEFLQRIGPVNQVTAQAYAHGHATPYHAVAPLLRCLLNIEMYQTPTQQRLQIRDALKAIDPALADDAPLLADMLNVSLGPEVIPVLAPAAQRRRLQHVCLQILYQQALNSPLCVLVEDGHWLDQSSQELFDQLVIALAHRPILFLCTARSGFRHAWADQGFYDQMGIAPLSVASADALIREILSPHDVAPALHDFVWKQTGGNPLFLEELLHTMAARDMLVLYDGRYTLQTDAPPVLPATIQDIVQARVNQLPEEARYVLQVAAVINGQMPLNLLQALVILPEHLVRDGVTTLLKAEILYEQGLLLSEPVYIFKHTLLQEAVYNSLTRRTRYELHTRIAEVLVAQFPEKVQAEPEAVAQHYRAAEQPTQAVCYWQLAGEHALRHSAYVEAMSHLSKGLDALEKCPETPEHLEQGLRLRTEMGSALMAVKGQTAPEVVQIYEEAYAWYRRVGDQHNIFPILLGLWRFYGARGALEQARELAQQLLRIADASGDSARLLEAHMAMGNSRFFDAEFAMALAHFEEAIALYKARPQPQPEAFSIRAPGVVCYSISALALWKLGCPDQALCRSHQAIALAQDLAHPMSLAFASYQAGLLHQLRREPLEALKHAKVAIDISIKSELGPWLDGQATVLRGWAMVQLDQGEAGIAEMVRGMAALAAMETKMPWPLCQLADGYRHLGRVSEALEVLARETNWTPIEAPCVAWLRGKLHLMVASPNALEAKSHLLAARERFRQQGAKSDELRVVMSLCRLGRQQGDHEAVQELLRQSYSSFTEGFDTLDLTEARSLLWPSADVESLTT